MDVKPIAPSDIAEYKRRVIPNEVLESVNELIAMKFVAGKKTVIVKQQEIIDRARSKMYPDSEPDFKGRFDTDWLNFESVYEDAGWWVSYDKPAYYEDYDAYFEFKVK